MDQITTIAEYCAGGLELLGVSIIMLITLYSTGYAIVLLIKGSREMRVFHAFRHQLVQGILLGLEVLVAADIVRTVAIEFTFSSVGVLAAVILVRTFLSFTLEVEMTGHWPWQARPSEAGSTTTRGATFDQEATREQSKQ